MSVLKILIYQLIFQQIYITDRFVIDMKIFVSKVHCEICHKISSINLRLVTNLLSLVIEENSCDAIT